MSNEWEEDGECRKRGLHPNDFDDYGLSVTEAKKICAVCPVQEQCLIAGLPEPWGIWGGLNTPERKAYMEGNPIRRCDGCGVTFARTRGALCMICQQTPISHTEWSGTVAELAAKGMTDPEIAWHIAEQIGDESIQPSHVRSVRRRGKIPPGTSVRVRAETGGPKRRKTGYSELAVGVVEERGHEGYSELSIEEKIELMRRWLLQGGTPSTFARRYRCSGTRAVELRNLIEVMKGPKK